MSNFPGRLRPQALYRRTVTAVILAFTMATSALTGCHSGLPTPSDASGLAVLDSLYYVPESAPIAPDALALYVDYSNCNSGEALNAPFYQAMVPPLVAAAREYWSIKGDSVTRETGQDFYTLLNSVQNVDYAALDDAIDRMAQRDTESVLITDGELFRPTVSMNNPNNPYMARAFKRWLQKGHDIFIFAEPYVETYRGQQFQKKRFYIVFTNTLMKQSIFFRLMQTVDMGAHPEVEFFHLGSHYGYRGVPDKSAVTTANDVLNADVRSLDPETGRAEIQDWPVDWATIEDLVIGALDEETGEPLPMGQKLMTGVRVIPDAFGGYTITDVDVKAYDINQDYAYLTQCREEGIRPNPKELTGGEEMEGFVTYDKDLFRKSGAVDVYFDAEDFAPEMDGDPFNYFKVVVSVDDVSRIPAGAIERMFNFQSIVNPGQTNQSVSASIQQCLSDPQLVDKLQDTPIYTVYVKSNRR